MLTRDARAIGGGSDPLTAEQRENISCICRPFISLLEGLRAVGLLARTKGLEEGQEGVCTNGGKGVGRWRPMTQGGVFSEARPSHHDAAINDV